MRLLPIIKKDVLALSVIALFCVCSDPCRCAVVYSNLSVMGAVVTGTIVTGNESNRLAYSWSDTKYYSLADSTATGYTYVAATKTNITGAGSVTNVIVYSNTVPLYAVLSSNVVQGYVALDDGTIYDQFLTSVTSVWALTPSREYINRVVIRGEWVQIDLTQKTCESTLIVPITKISSIKSPTGQFTEWPYNKR